MSQLKTKLFIALFLSIFGVINMTTNVSAQAHDELAPVVEKELAYKNWNYKSLDSDEKVSLREWSKNKKLVMVLYFAPWCGNWRHEAPLVAKLYDKYKDKGFGVIAVSEYAPAADSKTFFGINGAPYPVVVESESRGDVTTTEHYTCRMKTGDTRRWGSPYHVFLEPKNLIATGDVLTNKVNVVNGELIEADAEKFIREKLGVK